MLSEEIGVTHVISMKEWCGKREEELERKKKMSVSEFFVNLFKLLLGIFIFLPIAAVIFIINFLVGMITPLKSDQELAESIRLGNMEADKVLSAQHRKQMGLDPEQGDENATIENAFDNLIAAHKENGRLK